MAKKAKNARIDVLLQCTESGQRTYITSKNVRVGYKLELRKYNPLLRKHTVYKERKK